MASWISPRRTSFGLWTSPSRIAGTFGLFRLLVIFVLCFNKRARRILKGNLAPGGAVAKITGKEGLGFTGKARAFDTEADMFAAVESGSIKKGEKTVVILRYLGPKGGPGMPEMLKPTSLIMGAGLGMDVACLTDGRFSGGSHGFCIG